MKSEELEIKLKEAEEAERSIRREYHAALVEECPIKPGMVIDNGRKGEMLVTRVAVKYGSVSLYGNFKVKSGAWGNRETDWWDLSGKWPKVIRTEPATGGPDAAA